MFGDIPGDVRTGGRETNMRTNPYAARVAALGADDFALLAAAVEARACREAHGWGTFEEAAEAFRPSPGRPRCDRGGRPVRDRIAEVALQGVRPEVRLADRHGVRASEGRLPHVGALRVHDVLELPAGRGGRAVRHILASERLHDLEVNADPCKRREV